MSAERMKICTTALALILALNACSMAESNNERVMEYARCKAAGMGVAISGADSNQIMCVAPGDYREITQ